MKKYELLYIVPAQYTDAEIEGIRQTVVGWVEKINAQITRHENLGKIKLAYPINKVRHGTYILVHFDLESHDVSTLDSELRMSHEILRHQIIVAPKGAADRKYEISSYVPPLADEVKRESSAPASAPTYTHSAKPKPLAPPPPMVKEESNLSVEELDKKLDELLEDDMSKSL
ncbi:30S ribosomal protein S6 [Patescibacteria group bacterium]|nr:30S ribosomal protein S6 [Patescibacteria group bacterium]MBU1705234.1 30S ribosomal protein S6 [Patescibacteria group bacterium]